MLKGFVLGILLAVLAIAAGVYLYFATGRAPVATAAAPMPFEKTFARIGLNAYLARLPHPDSPVTADEANLAAGAKIYVENCAVCHGLPGQPPTAVAAGMFPKPPELLHGKGVTDDDAWETYWKVKSGIRMSGMPAFQGRMTDNEMWQVSVLAKNADKIPPSASRVLAAGATLAPPPAAATAR
jgi:thiosulfate dehydrogenase